MCKKVLTCLFICKLKNRFIFTDIYLLIFTIHYLLSFDANDILNIWPTIFFFKMRNVRPCKYSRAWFRDFFASLQQLFNYQSLCLLFITFKALCILISYIYVSLHQVILLFLLFTNLIPKNTF